MPDPTKGNRENASRALWGYIFQTVKEREHLSLFRLWQQSTTCWVTYTTGMYCLTVSGHMSEIQVAPSEGWAGQGLFLGALLAGRWLFHVHRMFSLPACP